MAQRRPRPAIGSFRPDDLLDRRPGLVVALCSFLAVRRAVGSPGEARLCGRAPFAREPETDRWNAPGAGGKVPALRNWRTRSAMTTGEVKS